MPFPLPHTWDRSREREPALPAFRLAQPSVNAASWESTTRSTSQRAADSRVLLMAPTTPLATIILQQWHEIAMVRQGRHGHYSGPSRPRAAKCRPNWPHTHSLSHVAWIEDSPREHGGSDGRLRPVSFVRERGRIDMEVPCCQLVVASDSACA
ncbi:hypothetical protein BDP81DRAFT_37292 [Colletotrichum phormii]|uniref:Uncharacterized protein n=1 Tax=Colletotrichum phormii TaxID=359342 RepID=A0AAI9ZQM2_9PEZI|nr:uncharacterized protein BDP81DRAFT_37292 [Colletotrichum phormii]KAK1636379.1 hypothetical protein BDP81DRAFT_37292 [Colletotrichum phormii]